MEPRLRNILSASGAAIPRNDAIDTSHLVVPSQIPLVQLLEPLPSLAIDPLLESAAEPPRKEQLSHVEMTRLQPILDFLNNPDRSSAMAPWLSGMDSELESLVLPPIQKLIGQNAGSSNGKPGRAFKSGAPLGELLNAMSPLVASRGVETLKISDLKFIIKSAGQYEQQSVGLYEEDDQITSNSKRRKLDRLDNEATRTLPRPPRRTTKRQKMPALPPLLAPLHDPPVNARVVPSMNADRPPPIPDLSSPLPIPDATRYVMQNNTIEPLRLVRNQTEDDPAGDAQPNTSNNQGSMTTAILGPGSKQQEELPGPSAKPRKGGAKRVRWTAEETQCLIDGVERFGIGNWKKILGCQDYQFSEGRNSIDLKDRFRTCFPDEYRKSGSQRGKVDSTIDQSGKRHGRGGRTTVELEHGPFPKQARRQRKNFTEEEDDALLQGFLKYAAQWKKIQSDPELGLQQRTRTDLRDRFRNRYPQRFKEAGYVHKSKHPTPPPDHVPVEAESSQKNTEQIPLGSQDKSSLPIQNLEDVQTSTAMDSVLATQNPTALLEPPPSASKDESSHSLRLLASSFAIPDNYNLSTISIDDEDDDESVAGIHLNRSIFDWADQNKLSMAAAHNVSSAALYGREAKQAAISGHDAMFGFGFGAGGVVDRTTLASLDQLHVDPLDITERLPGMASLVHGQNATGATSVPLSRILNGG